MNVVVLLPGPEPELTPLRPPTPPRTRRRAAWLAVSALLHLLVLVAVLVVLPQPLPTPQEGGAPSVEMVFEAAPPAAPPAAAPQPEDVPTPGNNPVAPTALPDVTATQSGEAPSAPTPVPAAPAPEPTPPPAPPEPITPPEPAPPPPAPETTAPPEPTPAPPTPAPVEQVPPQPPTPPAVSLDTSDAPLLPPPVPVPEAPPAPLPPAPARPMEQARPHPAPNPFAGTLMLGGSLSFQRPPGRPAPRSGAPSRAIDLSLGPVSAEPVVSGRYAAAHAANTKKDWNSLFAAWFEQRKYYPAAAAERGEDGSSTIEITIDRYGHVTEASLVVTSGSPRLDAALLGTVRGATVPPPLPGMTAPFTAVVTLHYVLVR